MLDYAEIIKVILDQYAQCRSGTHGVSHWARVWENGLRLSKETGANLRVVKLFALFHDSKRITEGFDQGHGRRGAEFAKSVRGSLFDVSDEEFDLLFKACKHHTDGQTKDDITIMTCWDSDRLDLGRVEIIPVPEKLCTEPAKRQDTIDWALPRSETRVVPELIKNEWQVDLL